MSENSSYVLMSGEHLCYGMLLESSGTTPTRGVLFFFTSSIYNSAGPLFVSKSGGKLHPGMHMRCG